MAGVIFAPILVATSGGDGINLETLLRGSYGHLWYLTALMIALLVVHTYGNDKSRRSLFAVSFLIVLACVTINYFNVITGRRYDAVIALRELSGIPAVCIGGWLHGVRNLRKTSVLLFTGGILLTVVEAVWLRSLGARPADVQLFFGTLPVAAGLLGIALSVRDVTPVWLAEFGRRESLGIYLYHPLAIFAVASLLSGDIRLNTVGVAGLPIWIIAAVVTTLGLVVLRRLTPRLRNTLDGAR
ncbi:acyltransferase family protein [Paracoccus sp. R86501]|uniref:acyltransferase family protein n=1 Tax=Paracoccus sp. R86501 TaxID=3101711 RepID=UPI00366C3289